MEKGRAGNVEMHPRIVHVALQKFSCGDGTCNRTTDVFHIRNITLEQVIVFIPKRKLSKSFVNLVATLFHFLLDVFICCTHTYYSKVSDSCGSSAGERSKIHYQLRLVSFRIVKRIRQDQASFGIGI